MTGRSWRIGRIAGIPVGISPWWLLVVALISVTLGDGYFPQQAPGIAPAAAYALGVASALALFASVLLHELGHALVARREGMAVAEIDLWLLGGVARIEGEAHEPAQELRFAAAGPAVTAAVLACFGALDALLPHSTPAPLRALVDYQLLVNALILGFNLLPAFPLDGGRIARALLWRHSHDRARATHTAARLGRILGYLVVAAGAVDLVSGGLEGLWLAVAGLFVVSAAGAQELAERLAAALAGVAVGELMSAPVVALGEGEPLDAVAWRLATPRAAALPVVDALGRPVGVLTAERLRSLPPARRACTTVGELAERDPELLVAVAEQAVVLLSRPPFARVGAAVVVDERGFVAGVVSIEDIERAARRARLAPPRAPLGRDPVGHR